MLDIQQSESHAMMESKREADSVKSRKNMYKNQELAAVLTKLLAYNPSSTDVYSYHVCGFEVTNKPNYIINKFSD